MPKPLIGLTTSRLNKRATPHAFGTNEPYVKSITAAGGLPVLIPTDLINDDLYSLLTRLNGILFTGGGDIDPREYGNPPHPQVEGIDPERDRAEIHLVQVSLHEEIPFLGICRGCQVINVALGGSLYEHLPDQFPGEIQHDNHDRPRNYLAHIVTIQSGTQLRDILSERSTRVNSLHHQGVKKLAPELHVSALAPDGLIEAVEVASDTFGLAVQWHPEELQSLEPMRRLFQAFIQACRFKQKAITQHRDVVNGVNREP